MLMVIRYLNAWNLNFNYSFNIREDTSKPINEKSMRYPYRYTHNLSASGNIKISNRWNMSFNPVMILKLKRLRKRHLPFHVTCTVGTCLPAYLRLAFINTITLPYVPMPACFRI